VSSHANKPINWDLYNKKYPPICKRCGEEMEEIDRERIDITPIGPVVVSYVECERCKDKE
jgi:hypothetical protein